MVQQGAVLCKNDFYGVANIVIFHFEVMHLILLLKALVAFSCPNH